MSLFVRLEVAVLNLYLPGSILRAAGRGEYNGEYLV